MARKFAWGIAIALIAADMLAEKRRARRAIEDWIANEQQQRALEQAAGDATDRSAPSAATLQR